MTLVYLIVAWAVGIWLARLLWSAGLMSCGAPGWIVWAGLLALPAVGLVVGQRRPRWLLPAGLLLMAFLGALRYQLHPFQPCFTPADLAYYNGSADAPALATVVGRVHKPPEERDARVRVRLRAESVALASSGTPQPVRGDALFTVARSPELRYGDRIAVRGWLEDAPVFEDFDYKEYLARQGVHTVIQRPQVTVLARAASPLASVSRPVSRKLPSFRETGRETGETFWRGLYALRARGQAIIGRLLPEPESALLTGILLGVETGIDPDLYDQFNRTGTSHIIVISGFNIAIIAGLLTATLGRFLGRRRAFYPVVIAIVLYTLLVGADAAVTRAAIMGILVALAAFLGRQGLAIISLFVAGFVMTLLNPLALWDVGFQLSFMATLSLVLFATPLTRRFERMMGMGREGREGKDGKQGKEGKKGKDGKEGEDGEGSTGEAVRRGLLGFLNDALIVTLAAQILTLPLVAYYFGRVSIVSPLANLLILPVQPYVMIWGGAAVLLALPTTLLAPSAAVLWPLAQAIALVPWLALHWTVLIVQALATLPFAALDVSVGLAALWGYYGLLAVLMLSARPSLPVIGALLPRLRRGLTSSAALTLSAGGLVVVSALLFFTLRSLPDGRLHVDFLAVDRGEAILITTPDGQQVLIDGGAGPTALLSALGRRMPFYDRTLELVVVTNPGDERIGGLVGLPGRYRIRQVLQAPFPYPSASYGAWLRALQAQAAPIAPAARGARVDLGYGISLDVLHPGPEPTLSKAGEPDLAANSLVLRLSYGDTSFLLTGDATADVQNELAALGLIQPATVVKVPDGGRQAGFSQALLDLARPQHAVVFVQREDRYRDLAAAVQEAWAAVTGPDNFHRTDLAGTVRFTSDGVTLTVSSQQ